MQTANLQGACMDPSTYITYRALVEALIPYTPVISLSEAVQAPGAAANGVYDYLIWELDHSLSLVCCISPETIPLSSPTALLLNIAAVQYTSAGYSDCGPWSPGWAWSPFSALAAEERIRVLSLLEQHQLDSGLFPPPYKEDAGFTEYMVDFLNRATLFGNYSEWPAYGATRLYTPLCRRLEFFPVGWRQAEYPGVSKGYRAFRGYMLYIEREGACCTIV